MNIWSRKKASARQPHPDPRVEAQLQYVLSLYAAVARTSERVAGITREQQRLGKSIRLHAGELGDGQRTSQARALREEREQLEQSVRALHDQITERLAALGDDALYLGTP